MPTPIILIIDDDELIRWAYKDRLEQEGYRVVEAENGSVALQRFREGVDLVLLDFKLPDTDGVSLLAKIRHEDPDAVVILMTAYTSVESAVEAIKRGAYHYCNKPLRLDEMLFLVHKALETTRLRREVKTLRASQTDSHSIDRIIGRSPIMSAVKALIEKIARSPASTTLLTGESGTGKDLAAKAIHYNSDRVGRPFMNITCSALPAALLESELFGHERGAFTDAKQQKKGLLETADGGTVFLDEVGEMSLALQVKLLRFLEEKTFRRVGASQDIRVDVRVIAATNRNLEEAVREGEFRQDLYYRLRVLPIALPPLRERAGDIPLLINHYVSQFNQEFRKNIRGLDSSALELVEQYTWPGNIRELKNAIERAMLLADGDTLGVEDFGLIASSAVVSNHFRLPPTGLNFEQLERDLVAQALARTGGNQTRAAALLGMNRDQIRYRIEKFGLSKAKSETPPAGSGTPEGGPTRNGTLGVRG